MKCANGIYDGIPRLRMIHRALLLFSTVCKKNITFMFCLNAFFILIMIGKTIWLGIVWLQHPFAMVPYLYEFHSIKLQVIHKLKEDTSESGTWVSSFA